MKKKWIRLFQLSERSCLEESLNKFINEYPHSEVRVWTDSNEWFAQVIYSYPESPIYIKR